jgi:hypothetical protein
MVKLTAKEQKHWKDSSTPDTNRDVMPTSINKWKWFGFPGHFIASNSCQFRMCTQVGKYLISTVGAYRPKGADGKDEEIGCGRKFETFVFMSGKVCDAKGCGCGMPEISGSEIDSLGANDAGDARANHMKLCRKYSRK